MESYQFIKQIRQGNYGEVWLVKCSKTQKKYVLKQFDLRYTSKREQRSAFSEAQLLSTLKHPNIVTYLDSFYNSNGSLFIVMGYCECGDLYNYIKNRNGVYFEEKEIVNWFVQICLALKYLHDKHILHRDLKTENIFLTKTKLIKVGDLGIARVLKAAEEMATTLIGTPYYMSPEIFEGKPYNQKSDVWALGCCMYEIATLERAFAAQDIHNLIQKVSMGKVSSIPDVYSTELFNIISSMLKHDSQERPSVNELLLEDFVRKYILLFLEESPSKYSSKRSCQNTPIVATNSNSAHTQSNFNDLIVGVSLKKDIPNVVKIPDSNGNADGNDNSQHQASNKQVDLGAILPQLMDREHKRDRSSDSSKSRSSSIASKLSGKHPNKLGDVSPSSTKSAESSAENRSLIAQKLKSEYSFNLLNQITYTIKNSRFQDLEEVATERSQRVKFYTGTTPPKSADELYVHSKLPEQIIRNAISAQQGGSRVDECHLPRIGNNDREKSLVAKASHGVNFPRIQSSDVVSVQTDSEEGLRNKFISKGHRLVDKSLLQNIMTVKKYKNNLLIIPHHQKEEIAQELSHSAPTNINVLSLEAAQK